MHCSIACEAARASTNVRRRSGYEAKCSYEVAVNVYEVAVNEYEAAVDYAKLRWTMRSCGYETKLHSLRECSEAKLRLRHEAAQPTRMSRSEAVHTAFVLPLRS